jgi:hypothetical protein
MRTVLTVALKALAFVGLNVLALAVIVLVFNNPFLGLLCPLLLASGAVRLRK